MSEGPQRIAAKLPEGVRCAIALSYDLEMCAGYAPDGINHGRIMPALQAYLLRLCGLAEDYGTQLQIFLVCEALEEKDIGYLEEIVRRGHTLDSHTYSHQHLGTTSSTDLDEELSRANWLLQEKLGIHSTVLRGPYGYDQGWHNLPAENRRVILDNGFQWVSGEHDVAVYTQASDQWAQALERERPYLYPEGLVEIPSQGWSDRMWFDMRPEVDQAVIDTWRLSHGHRPVPAGWRAPWLVGSALEEWIALNLAMLDYAYEHRLLWVPTWHPYTHYLHDPECRMLESLLSHVAGKPDRVWVCTVRDAAQMIPV
jgi:peptidoglycan/xylan/chitin deacetylase (PgdA/CDA1 family)